MSLPPEGAFAGFGPACPIHHFLLPRDTGVGGGRVGIGRGRKCENTDKSNSGDKWGGGGERMRRKRKEKGEEK